MSTLCRHFYALTCLCIVLFYHNILHAAIYSPTSEPFFIIAGEETQANISAYIPDADLIEKSVVVFRVNTGSRLPKLLGSLNDMGENGDGEAGDGVYSSSFRINETKASFIQLRIVALRKRLVRPLIGDLNLPVVHVNTIQTAAQYNQTVDEIFLDLLATKDAIQILNNPATSPEQLHNGVSATLVCRGYL